MKMNGVRMQRRKWLKRMFTVAAASLPLRVTATMNSHDQSTGADRTISKLEKPKAEWRKLLPREAYAVLFEERTEAPFTSPLDNEQRKAPMCARRAISRSSARKRSSTAGRAGQASTNRSRGVWPQGAITGSSSQEPSTTAYVAVGTRGTCSKTGHHLLDSAGATTA